MLYNKIYIYSLPEKTIGSTGYYMTFNQDGSVNCHTLVRDGNEALTIKPAMTLDESMTRELIQAFMLTGQKVGIDIESESKAKGKLEATERHLGDLRALLKLK